MTDRNTYRSPGASLTEDTPDTRTVQTLMHQQNGVIGSVAGAAAAFAIAVLWHTATLRFQYTSLGFFIIAGIVVGVAVRVTGRPVSPYMRYVGLVFYLCACALALLVMGVPIVDRESGPALILVLLLGAGGWCAFKLCRRTLNENETRRLWRHENNPDPVTVSLANRGWAVALVTFLTLPLTLAAAVAWRSGIVHMLVSAFTA